MKILKTVLFLTFAVAISRQTAAGWAFNQGALELTVGGAARLRLNSPPTNALQWESSAPSVAQVFQNGFVVGLTPGQVRILARHGPATEAAECVVTVVSSRSLLVDPATLKQFPDNRAFTMAGRKCYGSELNGQRAFNPDERRFTHANRVINPRPLRAGKELDWELRPNTVVFDGAGVPMGTVPAAFRVGDHTVPVSMFNFGASKVINGRICVYAFSVSLTPSPALGGSTEEHTSTSAWLPLEDVVDKETLLERIGLGNARLPALPLEATGRRVTGGDPKLYMTKFGELSIVRQVSSGPVPSHYLRRPSGTVNLIYSVPGFGLGGEGEDSFLVSDGLEFFPAKGAKVFKQPTYFPARHPEAGKVSPQTMTFLYGAVEGKGFEPVYGWIAQEALAP